MSRINIQSSRGLVDLRPVMGRRGSIGPGSDITGAEIEAQLASVPQRVAEAIAADETVATVVADAATAALATIGAQVVTRDRYDPAIRIPGTLGTRIYTADATDLNPSGNQLDLRVRVALDDWTPTVDQHLMNQWHTAGTDMGFRFYVQATTGKLVLIASSTGSASGNPIMASSVAPTVTDGSPLWVRVAFRGDNGAGSPQSEALFYTSPDGVTWTQLGTTVNQAMIASIRNSALQLSLGGLSAAATGGVFSGAIYQAEYRTVIGSADPVAKYDATGLANPYVDPNGHSWTATGSDWSWAKRTVDYNTLGAPSGVAQLNSAGRLVDAQLPGGLARRDATDTAVYIDGTLGTRIYTPDAAGLAPANQLDLRVRCALDDWTPTVDNLLMSQWHTSTGVAFRFYVQATTGKLVLTVSSNGSISGGPIMISTVAPTVADGVVLWVRATFNGDSGGSAVGTFYTSPDGVTWTQLGTPVTQASIASIYNSALQLTLGGLSEAAAGGVFSGAIYQAEYRTVIGSTSPVASYDATVRQNPYTGPGGFVWTATGSWSWRNRPVEFSTRGAANGVATLGADGRLPAGQLPANIAASGNDSARAIAGAGRLHPLVTVRVDEGCGTTSGSATVSDAAAVAADKGRGVSGTGVPANTVITAVTPGASFTMSANATATGTATLTVQTLPEARISGASPLAADPTNPSVFWGKVPGTQQIRKSVDGGTTWTGLGTLPDPVAWVIPTPSNLLVACADIQSVTTPSTYNRLYRSTDGGTTFTKVADLAAGGYVAGFSFDVHTAGKWLVASYGYKYDSSTDGTMRNARQLYRSTDSGATWTEVLDIGGRYNRHTHQAYVAPDGSCWLTTGDSSAADNTTDGKQRAVWSSATGAAGTWTAYQLPDPDQPGEFMQAIGITELTGPDGVSWMYCAEDATYTKGLRLGGGRIYRFLASSPTTTVEIVHDPGEGWIAHNYAMGTDQTNSVAYAFYRSETATDRGRLMASSDGLNWVTMFESGLTGDGPGASEFDFAGDYGTYYGFRWARRKPIRYLGGGVARTDLFTFHDPGTIATASSKWVVPADLLGFSFRVVRVAVDVGTLPSSGSVVVTAKNSVTGALICRAGQEPTVGTSGPRTVEGVVRPGPEQQILGEYGHRLAIDVTGATGAAGLTVYLTVERIGTVPVMTRY